MGSDSNPNSSENNLVPSDSPTQQTRQRSVFYPGYNLQKAEELAKAVFDLGARNCDQDRVAQTMNYSSTGGSFKGLRGSANQFGLIQLGKNGYISVSDDWVEVFHSENPQLFKTARKKAMLQPRLYKQLIEEYAGCHLPNLEKLTREIYLNQKYGILKDAARTAARIFVESASYAGLLNDKGYLLDPDREEQLTSEENVRNEESDASEEDKEQKTKQTQQALSIKSSYEQPALQNDNSLFQTLPLPDIEGLEKYEITLVNRKKAYLYVPVPLPYGEKERLKKYMDLILEEPIPPSLEDEV